MRIASSTGRTKILPSPTSPVREWRRIVSTTRPLSLSSTTTSSFSLGRTLTVRVEPRYRSTTPFWRPEPLASMIDREGNPLSSNSVLIGSNASWRMNASIFFMRSVLLYRVVGCHLGGGRSGGRNPPTPADRSRQARGVLRLGDELLRVPVHAVRADVEAGFLLLFGDAETDRRLDQ